MLIEFSLSNRGSFATEQSLSLIASRLKDDRIGRLTEVGAPHKLEVLNSAIILGKNGSGKSTFVGAMAFVSRFVRSSSSGSQEGEAIPFSPNLLDAKIRGEDTHFRIVFSVRERVYQFEFSHNDEAVTREVLSVADRTVRFRKIYERSFDKEATKERYSFSEDLKGGKLVWSSSTRRNALFLSTAVQLNAEPLREPFEWLTKYMRAVDSTISSFESYTARRCLKDKEKLRVLELLKRLDIDIDDIVVEEEDIDEDFLKTTFTPEFIQKTLLSAGQKRLKTKFVHKDSEGSLVGFDLSDESSGTRTLFSLAGPLFSALAMGHCLVIDEINTNLHPLILQTLVDVFSDPTLNTRRAQLVFTSHDTSLLRDSYFRRDQIWFIDKDKVGRSSIVHLSNFAPRKGEALEKGYLGGRYGGIPAISPIIPGNLDDAGNDAE